MTPSFLRRYLNAFGQIDGWFSFDAALLFFTYAEALRRSGITGDTLEIGVHHGLSAIAIEALTEPSQRMVAVDLFENSQEENVSGSGAGHRATFEANMAAYSYSGANVQVHAGSSRSLSPDELGRNFIFCHIDGGHSRSETYQDLMLCEQLSRPGGIIVLDDYYNPAFPGVSEGAVQFLLERSDSVRPLAIGYNKVFFQKTPQLSQLNDLIRSQLPELPVEKVTIWDTEGLLFQEPIRNWIDLQASSPVRIVAKGSVPPRAEYSTPVVELRKRWGRTAHLDVTITNRSSEAFPSGPEVLGLSYHLLSASGEVLKYDNDRTWLERDLPPGESVTVTLPVQVPRDHGRYLIEIDLVWEGVCWFKELGVNTKVVPLVVG